MNIIPDPNNPGNAQYNNYYTISPRRRRLGKIFSGLIVIAAGLVWFAYEMDVHIPEWLIGWETCVMVAGLFVGASSGFNNGWWMVPIAVGAFFLIDDIYPNANVSNFIWPSLIVVIGLCIIFASGKRWKGSKYPPGNNYTNVSTDDKIDTVAVFGGSRSNVISKNFKGGEAVCVFGGTDINLTQADIQGRVELEIVAIFGGAQLTIPANWQVEFDTTNILGGANDKRPQRTNIPGEPEKILVLRGTFIFGGIEIKSF